MKKVLSLVIMMAVILSYSVGTCTAEDKWSRLVDESGKVLKEVQQMPDIRQITTHEIVKTDYGVTFFHIFFAQVTPDETGTPGNYHFHRFNLSVISL